MSCDEREISNPREQHQRNIVRGLVSVVIIDFNSGHYLNRCLTALEDQTYRQIEVIFVDNGSQDGSVALLRAWASVGRIRLFEGENVGFSKANNLAIRESLGEFVLALNADAFLEPDYLQKCVAAMSENANTGIVSGKLLSERDSSIIDSAGLYIYREGLAVDRGFGKKDVGQFNCREFVDGACAAAALYRRIMLDAISVDGQVFNESFFAFVEDVELSFRAACAGWRTLYIPEAVAYHVRGGSSQSVSEFATYLNERNLRVFLRNHFNRHANTTDQVLQWIVLKLRDVKLRHILSRDYRERLQSEVHSMCASMASNGKVTKEQDGLRETKVDRKSYLLKAICRFAEEKLAILLSRYCGPRKAATHGGGIQ